MKIRALLFAIALLFGAVLAGAADPRGEMRVALPWTPENLDPTMNLASIRATVGVSLFDSLVGRDADNRIVPQLAESWRRSTTRRWQLKLRRGVVFHNGEPFNAEAVRFTFERVLDPNQKSPNRANVGEVARVEVLDDYTVNLVTAPALRAAAQPAHRLPDRPAEVHRREGQPGPGPAPGRHRAVPLVELVKDDHLIVEAFDRHWRGAPPDPSHRLQADPGAVHPRGGAAQQRGGPDRHRAAEPWPRARAGPGASRSSGCRARGIIYLGLNALKKPLSDVRVRQALNYATDVDALVKSVLDGNGRRHGRTVHRRSMFGYDGAVKGYRRIRRGRARFCAEAGYPDGLEITLESPTGRYQGDKEIAEALGGQWQKAGFKPKVQVAEWGAYFKRYLGKQFQDAYLLGLGGPMQDGDELYNLVSSKGRGLYYKNDRIDTLFDLGRSTMDPADAAKDLRRSGPHDGRGRDVGVPGAAGGHLRGARPPRLDAARRSVDVVYVRHAKVAAVTPGSRSGTVRGGCGGPFRGPPRPYTEMFQSRVAPNSSTPCTFLRNAPGMTNCPHGT